MLKDEKLRKEFVEELDDCIREVIRHTGIYTMTLNRIQEVIHVGSVAFSVGSLQQS